MKPSWKDVNVPEELVNYIKSIPGGATLDYLVHRIVFRHRPRASFVYTCHSCGTMFRPERSLEEQSSCPSCTKSTLRRKSQWWWTKNSTHFSLGKFEIHEMIDQIFENYCYYFHKVPGQIMDCGWCNEGVYCQFVCGENIKGISPRLCFLKAAILCPYLWDRSFDWAYGLHESRLNTEFLISILNDIRPRAPII